ncbi:hypothetical protein E2C01_016823 [Portunus trituberculatus]|uniref:Uncharacterized protein n=1 Tax=Portunus trituberculatus TaxID=210409 RepID=A0A5B7DQ46_PORTR|nr:hypothetical protein [Portunus trituberculatus]
MNCWYSYCEREMEIRRTGSSSLTNYLPYASIRPAGFFILHRQALKFWISGLLLALAPPTMRLRYHEALLLALAPPFPRTDTSTPPLGEHLVSLRAGSSSHRKSSQPVLLLLLSIPSPATAVVYLPHSSFWTSLPGLVLSGSSLVRLTPVTQHSVSLHTTVVRHRFTTDTDS